MNDNSEITPFVPSNVQKVASTLKIAGNIGFWLQIVLGAISTVTLLLSSPILIQIQDRTQGIEFGIFSAVCGLILLAISIFISWRYRGMAIKLQNPDAARRPKKTETIKMIRIGLIINLVGMLLSILGAETLIGIVLAKSLTIAPGAVYTGNSRQFVNSADLLIIQANTNTITAHFAGIVTTLWLLSRMPK